MTDHRQLIRAASFWAVALSFAMALPTTKSEAQPLAPSLSQMQFQTHVLENEGAQVFQASRRRPGGPRGRRGWRGAGVRDLALALVPRSIAGGVHTVATVNGGDGPAVSKLKLPI